MNAFFRIIPTILPLGLSILIAALPQASAESSNARWSLDLGGHTWQMEGIRPGQGEKEQFHKHFGSVAGSNFNWNSAQVPGDPYTDLWRVGEIDDPHFGRQGMKAKWVMEKEWWYRTTFSAPAALRGRDFRLVFDGVDYSCDVWINGQYLGHHEGMGSRFEFDINPHLRFDEDKGVNGLVVRLNPPPRNYQMVAGRKFAWHGDYWRTIVPFGIWQTVRVEATGPARITDVYPTSRIHEDGSATVTVKVSLSENSGPTGPLKLTSTLRGSTFEGTELRGEHTVPAGTTETTLEIKVPDARLWWPWDLGKPELYQLDLALAGPDGSAWDQKGTRFGIRELRMERNPGYTEDEVQHPWTLFINGKRTFLRSASWGGPPDLFYGRNSPEKYRKLIEFAREANINNLRIFGWHPTEVDHFYDLCDELGVTVWQDLIPIASVALPKDEEFKKATFAEALNVLRRLRPHPSVVLLEGGEESFYGRDGLEYNAKFLTELGELIRPHTELYYIPTSPLHWPPILHKEGLGKPKDSGHTHKIYYSIGAVLMEEDIAEWDYAAIPEFGVTSCPNVESIRRFIPENEVWPPGPSWGHHWADLDILRSINFQTFGDERTGSLDEFVEATQIAQGTVFQLGLEHMRRRKPKSSAIAICHFMTFAPDFKWGIVDYFQEKKRSFDFVRRAYQPLLVSMQVDRRRWLPGDALATSLWITNDFHRDFENCTLETRISDASGTIVHKDSAKLAGIPADSSAAVSDLTWKVAGKLGDSFRVTLVLTDSSGQELSSNYYDLLVGDQDQARKDSAALSAKFRAIREKFPSSAYSRYFPDLTDPSRTGDTPPTAEGFGSE